MDGTGTELLAAPWNRAPTTPYPNAEMRRDVRKESGSVEENNETLSGEDLWAHGTRSIPTVIRLITLLRY
jgi:hypothetical protein